MRTIRLNSRVGLCGALLFFALPSARAAIHIFEDTTLSEDTHEDQLYSDATRAINEGRWSDAEPLLDQVFNVHGRRSDAALYWKAYVKMKEGRSSDALEACTSLRQNYSQSTWLKDCSALEIEIRGKSGSPIQPQAEQDDELKLLALSSLMQ